MVLNVSLNAIIFEAADVHLCSDAVDFCNAVGLPLLDPLNKTPHFLVAIPVRFKVVVVDKELQFFRITLEVLASACHSGTHVFERLSE